MVYIKPMTLALLLPTRKRLKSSGHAQFVGAARPAIQNAFNRPHHPIS